MNIDTHKLINNSLCGTPLEISKDNSKVILETIESMASDDRGLIHGGFVFGAADYAAMLAVNHPNVVLGSSNVTFLKPVKCGEKIILEAKVDEISGKKRIVNVSGHVDNNIVFKGKFICFVLPKHVMD